MSKQKLPSTQPPAESKVPVYLAVLFFLTFIVLVGLIAFVMMEQQVKTMMALSAVAYALAAMGFLAVVGWAYLRGQFTDYEAVKEDIFEIEARE